MALEQLLVQNREPILKRWRNLILDTYPPDGSVFFGQEKDRFANPVGTIITEGIEGLYNNLIGQADSDMLSKCLDSIIRVRAVQDFSPSGALTIFPLLKKSVREYLGREILESHLFDELLELESRIDEVMLLAIDIYVKCRQQVHDIRIRELKAERDGVLRLLARTGPSDEATG